MKYDLELDCINELGQLTGRDDLTAALHIYFRRCKRLGAFCHEAVQAKFSTFEILDGSDLPGAPMFAGAMVAVGNGQIWACVALVQGKDHLVFSVRRVGVGPTPGKRLADAHAVEAQLFEGESK
jgi:hypothetical protein